MRTVWSWMARKNDPTRERRMLWNYGGPDLPRQQPEALPSGERLEKQISSKLDSARSLQGRVGGSQEMQKKTYNAIQENMKHSEEIRKTTYQPGVTYRLGSGAGPGGMGMSEGFRRAMPDPTVGPQYAMNNLSAWGGGDMDYAGLMQHGYSMGPRRGPPPIGAYPSMMPMPMGAPQFAQGPYMQQMGFNPYGGEQVFLGPNMGPSQYVRSRPNPALWQQFMPRNTNVDAMSQQELAQTINNFLQPNTRNVPPQISNLINSLPIETQRAIVRLIQAIEGPDGQILIRAVSRLIPANPTPEVFTETIPRVFAVLDSMAAHLPELRTYLTSRAPAALDVLVAFAPPGEQTFMRAALVNLSTAEAGALLRILGHIDAVGQSIGNLPDSIFESTGLTRQQNAKINAQPQAKQKEAVNKQANDKVKNAEQQRQQKEAARKQQEVVLPQESVKALEAAGFSNYLAAPGLPFHRSFSASDMDELSYNTLYTTADASTYLSLAFRPDGTIARAVVPGSGDSMWSDGDHPAAQAFRKAVARFEGARPTTAILQDLTKTASDALRPLLRDERVARLMQLCTNENGFQIGTDREFPVSRWFEATDFTPASKLQALNKLTRYPDASMCVAFRPDGSIDKIVIRSPNAPPWSDGDHPAAQAFRKAVAPYRGRTPDAAVMNEIRQVAVKALNASL